jgi:hypothetical protein
MHSNSKEKIKKIRERALLREYLSLLMEQKNLLNEEGDFFQTDFARMFGLDSVKNIVDTSLMGVKKLATVGAGEAKIAAKSLAFALIPGIVPDAGSIAKMGDEDREDLKDKLKNIDSQYAEVIKKNEEIFDNPDFNMALFIANPGIALGKWASNHVPGEAKEIVESIIGSEEDLQKLDRETSELVRKFTGTSEEDLRKQEELYRQNKQLAQGARAAAAETQVRDTSRAYVEEIGSLRKDLGIQLFGSEREARKAGFLREANQPIPVTQQPVQQPAVKTLTPAQRQEFMKSWNALKQRWVAALQSTKIQTKLLQSPMVQKGQQILIDEIMNKARGTLNNINFENIKQKYKANIEQYFKSKKINPEEQQKQLANPEIQKELVATIRAALKPAYVEQLNALKKQNPALSGKVDIAIKELEQIAPGNIKQ